MTPSERKHLENVQIAQYNRQTKAAFEAFKRTRLWRVKR